MKYIEKCCNATDPKFDIPQEIETKYLKNHKKIKLNRQFQIFEAFFVHHWLKFLI